MSSSSVSDFDRGIFCLEADDSGYLVRQWEGWQAKYVCTCIPLPRIIHSTALLYSTAIYEFLPIQMLLRK